MDSVWILLIIVLAIALSTVFVLRNILGDKRAQLTFLKEQNDLLQNSEEYFRLLVEQMTIGIVVYGPKAEVLFCNNTALAFLGSTKEDLIGQTLFGKKSTLLTHDGSPFDLSSHPVSLALASRQPIRSVVIGVRWYENVKPVWISVNAEPQYANDGTIKHVLCTLTDIGKLKSHEETIRQEKDDLQSLIDYIPDAIAVKDLHGTYLMANTAFVRSHGIAATDDVAGKTDFNLLPHAESEISATEDRQVAESGSPILNKTCLPFNGHTADKKQFCYSKFPLRKSDGAVNGILWITSDISEHKKGEESLLKLHHQLEQSIAQLTSQLQDTVEQLWQENSNRKTAEEMLQEQVRRYQQEVATREKIQSSLTESEHRFRRIVDQIPMPACVLDVRGTIELSNPAFCRLLSVDMLSAGSANLFDFIAPGDRKIFEREWNTFPSSEILQSEFHLKAKSGCSAAVSATITKLEDVHGKPVFAAFFLDLTEKRKMEETIRNAQQNELSAHSYIIRFLSTVARELRMPLMTIASNKDLLIRFGEKWEEEKRERALRRIDESVERLTEALQNVQMLGKIEEQSLRIMPEQTDLEAVCQEIAKELFGRIGKRHNFQFSVQGNVRSAAVDGTLTKIMLTNLLSNSIRYSAEGSGVFLHIDATDEKYIITVRDSGIGIPPEYFTTIFQPFSRAANADHLQGMGLGLTVARHCAEAHGGTLTIESDSSNGTTATIILPKKIYKEIHAAIA